MSHVRRLSLPQVQSVYPTHAQIGLWPTPQGAFTIADAHAIKVRGYRGGPSNLIVAEWQQLNDDIV